MADRAKNMTLENKDFDIIVYGASGYAGQYVVEELCRSPEVLSLKWAIAGRNIEKLKQSLSVVQGYLDISIDIRDTPIIYADYQDPSSIFDMCKKTKLVLNCVGPYNLYGGELVVEICIECGTHYIDISAEMKYLENIQVKYFKLAHKKKVYVVEACGIGSLPADYGISLLKNEFPGDLNAVEYFVKFGERKMKRTTNIGTFLSGIYSFKDHLMSSAYDEQLKTLFKKPLPCDNFKLNRRWIISYRAEINNWCVWFLGPDGRVLDRSQKFRYEFFDEKPVQSQGYFIVPSFMKGVSMGIFCLICAFLSLFSLGNKLLRKYPDFFTGGEFSKEGPTREQVLDGYTQITLHGTGWEQGDDINSHPNSKIKLIITGPEAGYPFTAMCMVQAGLTVLYEKEKLPFEGGVYTPGVAFERTTLRRRLEQRGMEFRIEK